MWKAGQLVTIQDSVYRVVRGRHKYLACMECDANRKCCDTYCVIHFKKHSIMCERQLPPGLVLKRIGVKYVDLGLSSGTLWAECNVGAKTVSDCGKYLTFEDANMYTLPTKEQFEELIRECEWKWTGCGYWVTGRNGNKIFLPAAGFRDGTSVDDLGTSGYVWSSTLDAGSPYFARGLYFNSTEATVNYNDRYYGFSVRAVLNKKPISK